MSKNGEIYTTGKNFTLLPGLTGWTNSTSVYVCGVGTPKTVMTTRMNTFWEHLCHLSMVFFLNDATFV